MNPPASFMDVLRRLATFADIADIRAWNYDDKAIISDWGTEGVRATITLGDARYARDFIRRIDETRAKRNKLEPPKAAFGD